MPNDSFGRRGANVAAIDTTQATPRRQQLIGVQAGRGIAALLVVFYHAGRMVALPQYVGHVPMHRAFAFGHAGVDFFFVLSGFIIMFVHRTDLGRPERLPRYTWRRVTRIYPLYWVVTGIVIAITLASPEWTERLRPAAVFASLALLPHGEDPLLGVAWTLEHEMLFYLAFAAAILRVPLGLASAAIALVLIATAQIVPLPGPLAFVALPYHLEFGIGVVAAMLVQAGHVPAPRRLACAGPAAFLAIGVAEDLGGLAAAELPNRLLYGCASAAVMLRVATAELRGTLRFGRTAALLGAASYSIYLLHTIIIGLGARGLARLGLLGLLPDWLTLLLLACLATACGIAFHLGVERRLTAALRHPGRRPSIPACCDDIPGSASYRSPTPSGSTG